MSGRSAHRALMPWISTRAISPSARRSAAGCWSLTNYGPRITAGNFDPGFFIKHFVKDMGIALAEARAMKLSLPGLALAHQFYVAAMALGWENLGTHALYKVLATMNGMKA